MTGAGTKRPLGADDMSLSPKRAKTPGVFSNVVALCWDIEAMGFEVIGIGLAVMDVAEDKILDTKLLKSYYPSRPKDERSWKEFWCNNQNILDLLAAETEGGPTFLESQIRMANELMAFVANAERLARDLGKQFHIVSDNKVFDIGLVNRLIHEHYDEKFQFPYSALSFSKGDFNYMGYFYELQSMQRALLCLHAPDWAPTNEWGYTEKVRELWGIPEPPVKHDHNPVNDAISQLYEYQAMLRIFDGKYQLQTSE